MPRLRSCKPGFTALNFRGLAARDGEPIAECAAARFDPREREASDPDGELAMLRDAANVIFYAHPRRRRKLGKVCIRTAVAGTALYGLVRAFFALDAVAQFTNYIVGLVP